VLIASLSFEVRPETRTEFVSAVNHMMQTLRWSDGCLGCRFVSDCENENLFSLISEWDNRTFLDRHLGSTEFKILEGTRFLLRDGPRLSIDEVVSRGRLPGTARHPERAS
jgi:quinol monooxygenase YgiN